MFSGYKNLIVYQKAHYLVKSIYLITKQFPKDELVEGYGRRTIKDKVSFFYISRSSLNELEYYIDLSFELNYINQTQHAELVGLRNEVGKLLNGLINSFQNR